MMQTNEKLAVIKLKTAIIFSKYMPPTYLNNESTHNILLNLVVCSINLKFPPKICNKLYELVYCIISSAGIFTFF